MPYIEKKFSLKNDIKAWSFLTREIELTMREAQRAIDRKQLLCNGEVVQRKSQLISGEIMFLCYEPRPKHILPIYENEQFALFDKPSGVLAHPRNRHTEYSLNDEVKYLFGKNANIVHRLDKETSGLILVSKDKKGERELKLLFEKQLVQKEYIALARGEIKNNMIIDAPILTNHNYDLVKLKVFISENGKKSITEIYPLKYLKDLNVTLVKAVPKSGRQHQIRIHLFHVEHCIVGDPIYGQSSQTGADYLDGKISDKERIKFCGASRVLLHSNRLVFSHEGAKYDFVSKYDAAKEFEKIAREK